MPPLHPLEPGLSVCGQLQPEDVAALAAAGFRTLICNRPDHEEPEQPAADAIERQAQAHGLAWAAIPITSASLDSMDVRSFAAALDSLPRPILAYCRSGNRCCVLWALARSVSLPEEHLVETAQAAGYNLDAWLPRMRAQAAAKS